MMRASHGDLFPALYPKGGPPTVGYSRFYTQEGGLQWWFMPEKRPPWGGFSSFYARKRASWVGEKEGIPHHTVRVGRRGGTSPICPPRTVCREADVHPADPVPAVSMHLCTVRCAEGTLLARASTVGGYPGLYLPKGSIMEVLVPFMLPTGAIP